MTLDQFPRCYSLTMGHEKGFVSQAEADRLGWKEGATNYGIALATVRTLDANGDGVLDFDVDGDGDVDEADIRSLDLFPEKRLEFYRTRYWNAVRAGEMVWPWCLLAFDGAVNHGPVPAIALVQKSVGVKSDGVVGIKTLAAVRTAGSSARQAYFGHRGTLFAEIYHRRGGPIRGWLNRLALLHEQALDVA